MTYEEAEQLQAAVQRATTATNTLGSFTYAGEGEDPQLVERAEEYLAAHRELKRLKKEMT